MKNKSQKKSHSNMKLITGGGCDAPDVVSQYINPPHFNPTGTIEGTQNIFQRVFYGPNPSNTNIDVPNCHQSGGGYIFDLENRIENLPAVQGYPDNAPPVILNQKVYLTRGFESQCGAGKLSLYKVKKHSKKQNYKLNKKMKTMRSKSKSLRKPKNKHNKKSNNTRGGSKYSKTNPKQKTKHTKSKTAKKHRKHKLKLKGGSVDEPSVFTPNMMERTFDCSQPVWQPKCI